MRDKLDAALRELKEFSDHLESTREETPDGDVYDKIAEYAFHVAKEEAEEAFEEFCLSEFGLDVSVHFLWVGP